MKITGAIFDMDGTLLDSMHIWENIGEDILSTLDITPRGDLREQLRLPSLTQAAEYLIAEYGVQYPVAHIIELVNGSLEHQYREVVLPKPGAPEFWRSCARAVYPCASQQRRCVTQLRRLRAPGFCPISRRCLPAPR